MGVHGMCASSGRLIRNCLFEWRPEEWLRARDSVLPDYLVNWMLSRLCRWIPNHSLRVIVLNLASSQDGTLSTPFCSFGYHL